MAYKAFKGKWQAFGDKPVISILATGLICFNKVGYDQYVKPSGCKYVKLYYEPDMRKVAFEFRPGRVGDFVMSINLTKTGYLAVVNGKTFFKQFKIKRLGLIRSARPSYTIPARDISAFGKASRGLKSGWMNTLLRDRAAQPAAERKRISAYRIVRTLIRCHFLTGGGGIPNGVGRYYKRG